MYQHYHKSLLLLLFSQSLAGTVLGREWADNVWIVRTNVDTPFTGDNSVYEYRDISTSTSIRRVHAIDFL